MLRLVLWLLMLANTVFFIWLIVKGYHSFALVSLFAACVNAWTLDRVSKK